MRHIFFITLCMSSLLMMTSCGKHETEGRTIGTVAGATIGTVLSGGNSKGDGAVLGALIGNYIGGEYGRAQDDAEEEKRHDHKVTTLQAENQQLKRQLMKYCQTCSRKVRIRGAQSCPSCGDKLIHEKFCNRCRTIFTPQSGYRFCPYCSVKVALLGR